MPVRSNQDNGFSPLLKCPEPLPFIECSFVTVGTAGFAGSPYFVYSNLKCTIAKTGPLGVNDEGIPMNQSDILRVLVADDEESFLRVLTTVLESTGRFTVFPCKEGGEAVAALKRSQFDIVILDYKMPEMTGLNVLQWIDEQKLDIPVIMLTGAGSENIAVEAMKLGAYDYLQKDSFDRNHFPVVVQGVYERYLFKKDKQQREARARRLERGLEAIELLSSSLSTFAREMDATLKVIAQSTEESEHFLPPHLSSEGQEHFSTYLKKIREDYKSLHSISGAIVSLSQVMNDNYHRMQSLNQTEIELVEKLKTPAEKPPQGN